MCANIPTLFIRTWTEGTVNTIERHFISTISHSYIRPHLPIESNPQLGAILN